jgi:hypothetical protein
LCAVVSLLIGSSPLSFAAAEPERPSASASILATLASIERTVSSTKYAHRPRIDVKKGRYEWDCSIMAAWVLSRAAPQARRALGLKQPLARDFYRTIAGKSTQQPRHGWLKVVGPSAIEPGDLFAWIKPPMFKQRKNTGHVGFVIGKPWRHPNYPTVWLMRIADATHEPHEKDSRPPGGVGGFGQGTVAFDFDEHGRAIAYGWYGEGQDLGTYVPTPIVFGRVFRPGTPGICSGRARVADPGTRGHSGAN